MAEYRISIKPARMFDDGRVRIDPDINNGWAILRTNVSGKTSWREAFCDDRNLALLIGRHIAAHAPSGDTYTFIGQE